MMFCPNCGNNLPDDARFCGQCGTQLAKPEPTPAPAPAPAPAPEPTPAPAPVFEPAPVAEPVYQEPAPVFEPAPAPVQPTFQLNTEAEPPKKAKKSKKGLVAVIAVITALAVLVGCFFAFKEPIMNLLSGKGSGEESGQGGSGNMSQLKNGLTSVYGAFLNAGSAAGGAASGGVELTVSAEVGDKLLDLVNLLVPNVNGDTPAESTDEAIASTPATGQSTVAEWLKLFKRADVTMSTAVDGESTQLDLGVGLNGVELLKGSMVLDMKDLVMYLGIAAPDGINKDYLAFDLEELGLSVDDLKASEAMTQAMEQLAKDLPSEAEFAAMLDGYLNAIAKSLADPAEAEETMDVGGIEQTVTVCTYEISEQTAKDLVLAVLKQAENDETLHQILRAVVDMTNTMYVGDYYYTPVDVDEIIAAIPDAIAAMEAEEADSEDVIQFIVYKVGGKVCGYAVAVESEDTQISWLSVENGSDQGFELKITSAGETVKVEGSGKKQNGKLTGTYALKAMGQTLVDVELEDFDTEACTGTIRVMPGAVLRELIKSEMSGTPVASLMDLSTAALELTLDTGSLDLSLLVENEKLISVGLGAKVTGNTSVDIPGSTVNALDEEALKTWAEGVKLEPIAQQLVAAGLPQELLDLFKDLTLADLVYVQAESVEQSVAAEQAAENVEY